MNTKIGSVEQYLIDFFQINQIFLQKSASYLAVIISLTSTYAFAFYSIYLKQEPQPIATWGMFLFIDIVGLALAYKAGNTRPWLQLSWLLSVAVIVIATIAGGNSWEWGYKETISVLVCLVAVFIWAIKSAEEGLWPFVIATYVAFAPALFTYWKNPQPDIWWFWVGTSLACMLSNFSYKEKTKAEILVPNSAIAINIVVLIVNCRMVAA